MENIVKNGEIACNKKFLLFSQCFLPCIALFFHFNPFTNKPWYTQVDLLYKSIENTVGKGEIAHKQFLLFPHCFLTFWITFSHVHHISNCRLQTLSVLKSLESVVWEKGNPLPNNATF